MGSCASATQETARNHEINELIAAQAHREKYTVKLLLLGAGDSGKTTIRKQMRSLYGEGFSEVVRGQLAQVIVGNLMEGAKEVIDAAPRLGIAFEKEETKKATEKIAAVEDFQRLSPDTAEALKTLYNDPQFPNLLERRAEFQLQDCWLRFIEEVQDYPEWGGPTWLPSIADCIISRVRTTGIVEEQFVIDGVVFKLFDVGGQRAERRKWIHCFDNVTAVIFVMALSEYDQNLFENREKNRLEEAVELFSEICNSKWFITTSMLLFLNKRDLFREKYLEKKVPLNQSGKFPDAPSGEPDEKVAIDWMTSLFLRVKNNPKKEIYTHVTTATDPHNIRAVFDTCRNIILKRNLEASGFMMNE